MNRVPTKGCVSLPFEKEAEGLRLTYEFFRDKYICLDKVTAHVQFTRRPITEVPQED